MQKLREWNLQADLNSSVGDYVAAMKRLPEQTSLKEAVDFYLKRHPVGMPAKSVRQVVDELVKTKALAGKSDVYVKVATSPWSFCGCFQRCDFFNHREAGGGLFACAKGRLGREITVTRRTHPKQLSPADQHPLQVCYQAWISAQRP